MVKSANLYAGSNSNKSRSNSTGLIIDEILGNVKSIYADEEVFIYKLDDCIKLM